MKPLVAIIGRANVGKSRLFNRIVGHTKAIVHDKPGITRDRHYSPADWIGREFIVVDTGGMEMAASEDLGRSVTNQTKIAVEEADVLICVFDGLNPPTPEDEDVVRAIRKSKKPIVWVVNKIDEPSAEYLSQEFARLGLEKIYAVSAEHGFGVDDVLDAVIAHFPDMEKREAAEHAGLRVSIVGKPNVGKSTLINRLAGSDRVVSHELPGTTRDAIDVEIEFEGKDYVFVDTAGVKRGWKSRDRLEKFTSIRSLRSVERSQIVCQLFDASVGISKHDLALTSFIADEGKGLILVVNKWDMVDEDWKIFEENLRGKLGAFGNIPIICISAATGYHCLKVFEAINRLNNFLSRKLATSKVNQVIEKSVSEHHLPAYRGRDVRIYYATQTGVYPPTFTLFSNYPAAIPYSYRRYLMHKFQEALGSDTVPVKIICRKRT